MIIVSSTQGLRQLAVQPFIPVDDDPVTKLHFGDAATIATINCWQTVNRRDHLFN
jgi:hypothetical protein